MRRIETSDPSGLSIASASAAAFGTIAIDLTPIVATGENGGAKVFVLELVRGLAAHAPATRFVLLTQASTHDELATLDRANVVRHQAIGAVVGSAVRPRVARLASRILPRLPRRVRRLLSRVAYDVNARLKRGRSTTLLRDLGVDLLFCPFTAPTYHEEGVPTVCTIHDLLFRTYPEFFSPEDAAHRARMFAEACRHAAALVAVSDHSRFAAIEYGSLDSARIRTVHHRMARRFVAVDRSDDDVLRKLDLHVRRFLIYPANFWPHKNHEMLLVAFGMARANGLAGDVRLVCTGPPGARRDLLVDAAARMGLGERVVFPGYVTDAQLATLMHGANAMVFPSLFEGFGMPVVEAMAAGVPVACSDTASLPEIAGDAALLFDPRVPRQIADAIQRLFADPALRQRHVEAGHRRAAVFEDATRMVGEYWEAFVAARRPGRSVP